jgi:hypothetical protein
MLNLAKIESRWAAGSWRPWLFGPDSVPGAAVVCPQGHAFSIGGQQPFGSVHRIAADGSISPSVVCPSCGWHVFAKLVGWNERKVS